MRFFFFFGAASRELSIFHEKNWSYITIAISYVIFLINVGCVVNRRGIHIYMSYSYYFFCCFRVFYERTTRKYYCDPPILTSPCQNAHLRNSSCHDSRIVASRRKKRRNKNQQRRNGGYIRRTLHQCVRLVLCLSPSFSLFFCIGK